MVSASPRPKSKKSTKVAKKQHPPYAEMITQALLTLKDRTGSSFPAIWKYMETTFDDINKTTTRLQLKRLLKEGYLVQIKNSFKLGKEAKKSAVSELKKKERADKKAATKKTSEKKVTSTKTKPKTGAKKTGTKAKGKASAASKKSVKPKAKSGKGAKKGSTAAKGKKTSTGRGSSTKKNSKAPGKSTKSKAIKKKGKQTIIA